MKEMYFTLTGCGYYLGKDFLEKGMIVKLKKEPVSLLTLKTQKMI